MIQSLRNRAISVVIVLVCVACPLQAALMSSISGTITPSSGYGQLVAGATHDHMPGNASDDLYTVFGFDAFPADTDYTLRVGVIDSSDWTGTSADWDKGVNLHVEYTSGDDGRGYTVVEGASDPGVLGDIKIGDLLGGIDGAVSIPDLQGGVNSLVIFTRDGDFDADGVRAKGGHLGTPTDEQAWTATGYDTAYLIAQVKDDGLTGQSITVDAFVDPVPEPATLGLLALGGLALIRKRKAIPTPTI